MCRPALFRFQYPGHGFSLTRFQCILIHRDCQLHVSDEAQQGLWQSYCLRAFETGDSQ